MKIDIGEFGKNIDWNGTEIGKTSVIVYGTDGKIDTVISGGKARHLAEAERWIDAHPRVKAQLKEWLEARRRAIEAFDESLECHRVDADGGCMAIRLGRGDGSPTVRVNLRGDGTHRVYVITDSDADESPRWRPTGTVVGAGADGAALLDYDCGGGEPVVEFPPHADISVYVSPSGWNALLRVRTKGAR